MFFLVFINALVSKFRSCNMLQFVEDLEIFCEVLGDADHMVLQEHRCAVDNAGDLRMISF